MDLVARLEWTELTELADAQRFAAALQASLPFLTELGRSRTRGFGAVRVKLTPLAARPSTGQTPLQIQSSTAVLRLTLLDDVVVSQTSATSGGHSSRPLIPGAQILGAAASKLYDSLGADAWRVFHQGAVRFGDGLWVNPEQQVCEQAPLSWHKQKSGERRADLALQADTDRDAQWTQQREGYTATPDKPSALSHGVEMRFGLRTALSNGVADDSLLFGYEAIERGQTFAAVLAADQPSDLQTVANALHGAILRIGRSRSAEYGRIRCTVEAHDRKDAPSLTGRTSLVLRAVSDLCLRDPTTGQPTLQLTREPLGLPEGWSLDLSRTYLRARTYRPFHGVRKRPGMERQVLVSGSVFCLQGPALSEADGQRLGALLQRGVGLYLTDGLGRLVVHEPDYRVLALRGQVDEAIEAPDKTPLIQLLKQLDAQAQLADKRSEAARHLLREIGKYPDVRALGKAQWGALRAKAMRAPDATAFAVMEQFVGAAAASKQPQDTRPEDKRVPARLGGGERRLKWQRVWEARNGLKELLQAKLGQAGWDGEMLAQWAVLQSKQGDEP